jgi:mannonate dehydratase
MICLAEFLPPTPHRLWDLSAQLGVTHAICKAAPELTGESGGPDDVDVLARLQKRLRDRGLTLAGLEGDQFDMSRIKLGLPGRDEDLLRYQRMLANMGELGIPLLCYNFMVGIGWYRTGEALLRGGARGTRFRLSDAPPGPAGCGPVSADRVWEAYEYFVRAVMPHAQRAGVRMALHPDDPPLRELRGVGRIFGAPDAFDRAYELMPCHANAVTFCQANFKLMGADLPAVARCFGDRIAYLHVRDVRGSADDFVELFHDASDVDQVSLFRLYANELNLRGVPLRCDHVPTMAGEADDADAIPGYGTLGRLLAIGYFKGVLQGIGASYQ